MVLGNGDEEFCDSRTLRTHQAAGCIVGVFLGGIVGAVLTVIIVLVVS